MHFKVSFFRKPVLIAWLSIAALGAQAATYYVSPAGNDANNGTSWALAKQTIQAGINVATNGDTVLVADGTFTLTNQISISPCVIVRSVNGTQATTINGGGVTRCVYMNTNAVLDGFTVTNGYSSDYCGGVLSYGGTVANCTISGNVAYDGYGEGGGVWSYGGTVTNCTIIGNLAVWGGGVVVWNATLADCTISGNTAVWSGGGVLVWEGGTVANCTISGNMAYDDYDGYGEGGGVWSYGGTVTNCTISSNTAGWGGGGVLVWEGGTVANCTINGNWADSIGGVYVYDGTMQNCTVSGNSARSGGGGVYVHYSAVQNCTISGNRSSNNIGGVWLYNGTMQNCIVSGNTAGGDGGGLIVWDGGKVQDCTISENIAYQNGGGAFLFGGTVQNCMISRNRSYGYTPTTIKYDCGGGVYVWSGTIRNCMISENIALWDGAGAFVLSGMVANCTISGNDAGSFGGGVRIISGTVQNCLISGNRAPDFGGGVEAEGGMVENCTITKNTVFSDSGGQGVGGGVYVLAGTVRNCIVYYNDGDDIMGTDMSYISYSCVGNYIPGAGNITNEPQFVSIGTGYGTNLVPGNYHLQADSPCLNTGTNQSWMATAVDLDGLPRIFNGVVDMGAYEFVADIYIMRNPMFLSNRCEYGSNATGQTIQVWNAGTGAMAYALSPNVDWLSLSPASGTSAGETDLVGVNYSSAGLAPGTYTSIVTITSTEAINSPQVVTVYLLVDKVDQTITFPAIVSQVVTGCVGLAATASSGLPVSFAVASGLGTITDGTNLSFTAAGTVLVKASQAGNAIYNPASDVTNTVLVERVAQTITFPAIPSQVVTSQVGLTATASSGLPVSFAVVSGPGIISGGTNLSFTVAGSVLIVASQAGNAIYHPAPDVMNSFSVAKATAAVTLHNLNQTYNGTARSVTASTVPEGLAVAITYEGSSWAPTDVGRYSVSGVVNDSIYEGSANGTLTVAKADQTITNFTPTNGANFAATSTVGLAAQASSGLLVTNFVVLSGPGLISGLTNLTFTNSGTVSVTADQAGNNNWNPAPAVTNSVLVERVTQTITFLPIPAQVVTSKVGLAATSSSGLPVSFAVVSGPGIISGGTNLSFTVAGSVLIVASQAGNAIYNPAPEVINSFSVTKATAVVTLHNLNQTYNGTARSVTASTVPEGLTVAITYDGSSSAPADAGIYAVAGVVNDTIYEGSANGTLTVAKADQTITNFTPTNWATFAATSTVGLAAQASSGLLVTNFAVLSGPGLISGLTNLTFTNSGPVSMTADQAGNNNWNPAPAVTNTVSVERVAQTITFPALSAQTVTSQVGLTATASSGLPVSFAVASGPGTIADGTNLRFTAAGIVQIVASQAGNTIYHPAPEVINSFSVTKATAVVTLHNLNQTYNGTARSVTASTVPEGLTVAITYDGSSWAPTDAGMYSVVGVVNDTIYQGSVNGTLTVAKADQTITSFTPTNGATFAATSTVGLAAQASSGLLVTNFAVLSGPGLISGLTNLTFTNSGPVSMTADQAGNNNWNPAPAVTNTVLVERVAQTITFPPIPVQVITSKVELVATASSGLPVSFVIVSGPGTISNGTNLTFTAAGNVQVVASQAGNAIYNPAQNVTNAVAIGRVSQTITFPAIPAQVVTSQVGLAATASSELPVSFTVPSGPGMIAGGTNLSFSATGIVWVAASQAGNLMWEAAASVTNAVSVMNPPAGDIRFAETNVVVDEDIVNVELRVIRTNGNYGVVSVDYMNQGATASAGLDYGVVTGRLTWVDGDISEKIITIPIVDDSVDESNEVFEVVLTNALGTSISGTNVASVTIVDNDNPPAGVIQFAVTSIEVGEAGGSVTLSVVRTGGNYGSASVDYMTVEGTATAGLDYEAIRGALNWPDGDASERIITIKILDDLLDEPNETFSVKLWNTVGTELGDQNTAVVTIVDNDEPPAYTADIEVSDLKFEPVNLWAGDHPAMISFDLVNDGTEDIIALGTQLEINFYLSSNTNFGDADDLAIGTTTEDITLSAGSQTTIRYPGRAHNTDVTIPEWLAGDFYVFVSVGLVSQSGLSDPDGADAMREGPIRVRIHPSDDGDNSWQRSVVNDYDGDGQSDMMAYDEPSGEWAIQLSASGESKQFVFGGPGYETAPGDYDGDLKTDPAVHNKNGSQWYLMLSAMEYQTINFDFGGESETKGVAGDFNGDNLADPGLYEEGSGRWYVLLPNTEHGNYEVVSVVFGGPGWTPVSGDYDGDKYTDPAVYEEETGEWRVMLSDKAYGVMGAVLGGPGYRAAVGDYDGDGKADPAVVSASGGWYYWLSSRGYSLSGPDAFGKSGRPVPGDYDGDGKADPAIVDSSGNWYFWMSSSFYTRAGPYYLVRP